MKTPKLKKEIEVFTQRFFSVIIDIAYTDSLEEDLLRCRALLQEAIDSRNLQFIYAIANFQHFDFLEDVDRRKAAEKVQEEALKAFESLSKDKRGTNLTLMARRALAHLAWSGEESVEDLQDECFGKAEEAVAELLAVGYINEIRQNPCFGPKPHLYQIDGYGMEALVEMM